MSEATTDEAPTRRHVIVCDDIVDVNTNESVPEDYFSPEAQVKMFNSAPSELLDENRGLSTHVVHTKLGYDIYFHLEIC